MKNLAAKWIDATKTQLNNLELNEEQKTAKVDLLDLCYDAPEEAYQVICQILKKDPPQNVIGVLGAGPLEELLVQHCELIGVVITNAENNKNLVTCLKSVYLDEEDCSEYYKIDDFLKKKL